MRFLSSKFFLFCSLCISVVDVKSMMHDVPDMTNISRAELIQYLEGTKNSILNSDLSEDAKSFFNKTYLAMIEYCSIDYTISLLAKLRRFVSNLTCLREQREKLLTFEQTHYSLCCLKALMPIIRSSEVSINLIIEHMHVDSGENIMINGQVKKQKRAISAIAAEEREIVEFSMRYLSLDMSNVEASVMEKINNKPSLRAFLEEFYSSINSYLENSVNLPLQERSRSIILMHMRLDSLKKQTLYDDDLSEKLLRNASYILSGLLCMAGAYNESLIADLRSLHSIDLAKLNSFNGQ
jgi:hypothetical protein